MLPRNLRTSYVESRGSWDKFTWLTMPLALGALGALATPALSSAPTPDTSRPQTQKSFNDCDNVYNPTDDLIQFASWNVVLNRGNYTINTRVSSGDNNWCDGQANRRFWIDIKNQSKRPLKFTKFCAANPDFLVPLAASDFSNGVRNRRQVCWQPFSLGARIERTVAVVYGFRKSEPKLGYRPTYQVQLNQP